MLLLWRESNLGGCRWLHIPAESVHASVEPRAHLSCPPATRPSFLLSGFGSTKFVSEGSFTKPGVRSVCRDRIQAQSLPVTEGGFSLVKKQALLVVDVQVGMFDTEESVERAQEFLATLANLISRARESGTLVVYVQHCGAKGSWIEMDTPGWPIHPSIAPSEGDVVLLKREPDAFHGTSLQSLLEKHGIRQLIITGIATQYCVDSTVRAAYRLGYDVVLVEDGHTTWSGESLSASKIIDHHNRTLQRFGAVVKAEQLKFGHA